MKYPIATIAAAVLAQTAFASDYATPQEAEAMVAKVVAAIKADPQKAFSEINAKKWIDRDLYPTVYDMNGKMVAHGTNIKMLGKDLIDLKDVDGKPYMRERIDMAKTKGKFWQDYKFLDPSTQQILPKQMYCEKADAYVVCAGVYRR